MRKSQFRTATRVGVKGSTNHAKRGEKRAGIADEGTKAGEREKEESKEESKRRRKMGSKEASVSLRLRSPTETGLARPLR